MAFCPHCGAKNDDGAASCAGCGAGLSGGSAPAPTPAPKKNSSIALIVALIVIAVLTVALTVTGWLLYRSTHDGGSGSDRRGAVVDDDRDEDDDDSRSDKRGDAADPVPTATAVPDPAAAAERTVARLLDAVFAGDAQTMVGLTFEGYVDYLCDQEDMTRREFVDQLSDVLAEMLDAFDDQFGDGWSVDFSVRSSRALNDHALADLLERYARLYDIHVNADGAVQLRLALTLDMGGESQVSDLDAIVVQVGDRWYVDPEFFDTCIPKSGSRDSGSDEDAPAWDDEWEDEWEGEDAEDEDAVVEGERAA